MPGESRQLAEAYAYCRDVTRDHAKSFYFCAQFLPSRKRRAIYAVYALCRHLDDLVDEAKGQSADEIRSLLAEWTERRRVAGRDDHSALGAWRDGAEIISRRN